MWRWRIERETFDRYNALAKPIKTYFIVASTVGMVLATYFAFGFSVKGFTFLDVGYFYLLFGIYGSGIFLITPEHKRLRWYDTVLAALFLAICIYFYLNAEEIVLVGWVPASLFDIVLAVICLGLILEACRRVVGFSLPIVAVVFGIYPLIAENLPGILEGVSHSFPKLVSFYIYGGEGITGIPGRVLGGILIGFLIFAGFLIGTGAGKFFLDAATAFFGRYRGGPAKVAVVASAFFGSLSGSTLSNIVATGSVTIPAMKRMGFARHYAGAVEACASTGGAIMPPVMGAVAFVMATLLEMPYYMIIVAAFVPSVLYYFALLIQVDAYAARTGIRGFPKEELPSLPRVLKKGWHFIAVLVILVWGLLYMRWEFMSPFYATALLILLSFSSRETMLTPRNLVRALGEVGSLLSKTTALFLPMGIVISAVTVTGLGGAFTSGAVALGGGNIVLIMLLGVAASYVMGMVGLILIAYIILAVSLAPAMIQIGGLNEVAVHLFIMYYSMLALITPPVAGAVFVASAIAGAPAMKTGFTAMRLGIVLYFIPFFFVFKPALILQGPILESIYLCILCLLGILFIAWGLGAYLPKVGKIDWWACSLLVAGGFLIAFPELRTSLIGAALVAIVLLAVIVKKRRKDRAEISAKGQLRC